MIDDPVRPSGAPNGTAAPEPPPLELHAPARFRLAPRYQRIELTGEYAGAWAEVLCNPPLAVLRRLDDPQTAFGTIPDLVRAWNITDAEGREIPRTLEGVEQLPDTFIMALFAAWQAARGLPKSG